MTLPVFRLQRKLVRFKPRKRIVNLVSIQRIKDEPSQCIAVDNEERQDRKSTRLNSSHSAKSRMPSSA